MPRLLFFTPVLPGLSGQGTAIRAGVALELLAERYEVTLIHIDLWSGDRTIADPFWPRKIATTTHLIPNPAPPDAAELLVAKHLAGTTFDAIYVFRLIAAPLALRVMALLGTPLPSALDLDDDECARTEKFLALRDAAGELARAARERAELHRQRGFARLMILRIDLALLASNEDLASIAAQYPGRRFTLLPNVMRVPETVPKRTANADSLLFIGTLDYLPNEDAVLFFANSILPLLLESSRQIECRIVGVKPPKSFEILAGRPGLTVVGPVREVAPEYARARLMIVPLRAGSGTRIKILEAFRFGVPVVSTTIGAAGLDVEHGVHLLIADTPEEFSAACLRLLDDTLAETLAANAFAWLRANHSMDRARAVLQTIFEPVS